MYTLVYFFPRHTVVFDVFVQIDFLVIVCLEQQGALGNSSSICRWQRLKFLIFYVEVFWLKFVHLLFNSSQVVCSSLYLCISRHKRFLVAKCVLVTDQ